MNHPHTPRRPGTSLLLAATLLCIALALPACSPRITTIPPDTTPAETTAPTTSDESLRTYYESLIAELKQALLEQKQSDYVTRRDYEERIAALEARLSSLQSPDREPIEGTDIPVSSTPDSPPTEPSSRPATAFQYTIEGDHVVITAYCGAAREVTIPASILDFPVTRIEDNAFRHTSVTSVTIPSTVTQIGWFAFADCPALLSVTLPASVTTIEYGAFENCPTLTLRCPKGSYAEAYAQSFALRVITRAE